MICLSFIKINILTIPILILSIVFHNFITLFLKKNTEDFLLYIYLIYTVFLQISLTDFEMKKKTSICSIALIKCNLWNIVL